MCDREGCVHVVLCVEGWNVSVASLIIIIDFIYNFPIETCATILGSNCNSFNQSEMRISNLTNHIIVYSYSVQATLVTIILKWLLLSQLSPLGITIKIPRC